MKERRSIYIIVLVVFNNETKLQGFLYFSVLIDYKVVQPSHFFIVLMYIC